MQKSPNGCVKMHHNAALYAVTLHSPKGRESEARSHLGSPLGELCNIVLAKLRFNAV